MDGTTMLQFRAKYNFTMVELAEFLGVTPAMIGRYEAGKAHPTRANALRFKNKMEEYERSFEK